MKATSNVSNLENPKLKSIITTLYTTLTKAKELQNVSKVTNSLKENKDTKLIHQTRSFLDQEPIKLLEP